MPIFIRIELFDKNSIRLLEKVSKTIKAIFELKFLPKMKIVLNPIIEHLYILNMVSGVDGGWMDTILTGY